MKAFSLILGTLVALTNVGCDRISGKGSGPVAVIDLDAVAKRMGKDKQMLQMIEQCQVGLNEQVVAAQKSLVEQLNQKKIEFGEISGDEANQLVQLQKQANSLLASTQTQAQTNLTTFQQEVVSRFRNEIKPVAMELATKKGCRVVLSKNDSVVFAFDETVDLTDEVVAMMEAKVASSTSSQTAAKGTQAVAKHAAAVPQANLRR